MSKLQLSIVSGAILLLVVLLFGFNTKPGKQTAINKSRALAAESTDINILLTEAREKLSANEATTVLLQEQSLSEATSDSVRIGKMEQLSKKWFDLGHPEIAGYYAEGIADITQTEQAWAISGTTYAIGVQRASSEKIRTYCSGRAVKAFQNAISINPDEMAHKVNLALCYTDNPPKDNPMKGILMLVDMNKKNPDDVMVLTQLGRLAIKTGQFEKAVQRLERASTIESSNAKLFCLLADAYKGLKNEAKVTENQQKCNALAN